MKAKKDQPIHFEDTGGDCDGDFGPQTSIRSAVNCPGCLELMRDPKACRCDILTKTWRPEDRAALCGHIVDCPQFDPYDF